MKTLTVLALIAACACAVGVDAAADLTEFGDGLQLMLCDRQGRCQNPGQLVLLQGVGVDTHHPFHFVAINPEDVSKQPLMEAVALAYEGGRFEVKCDLVNNDVFACGAKPFELD